MTKITEQITDHQPAKDNTTRILYIEDQAMIAAALKGRLEHEFKGIEIIHCFDHEEARSEAIKERLFKREFDFIITDNQTIKHSDNIDHDDGIEWFKEIKNDTNIKLPPVIMLSADIDREKFEKAGFYKVFAKGGDEIKVIDEIKKVLSEKEKQTGL